MLQMLRGSQVQVDNLWNTHLMTQALCVHLALAQNTRNLVDRSLLWKLKPGAPQIEVTAGI